MPIAGILPWICLGRTRVVAAKAAAPGEARALRSCFFRAAEGWRAACAHASAQRTPWRDGGIARNGLEGNFGAAEALSEAPVATSYRKLSRQVTHTFTHFRLRLDVYVAEDPQSLQAPEGGRFLPEDELEKEAFSSVMRKVIAAARRPWQMNSQSGFPDRTLGLRADQLRRSGG